jgi:hypothetical protein
MCHPMGTVSMPSVAMRLDSSRLPYGFARCFSSLAAGDLSQICAGGHWRIRQSEVKGTGASQLGTVAGEDTRRDHPDRSWKKH